MLIAILLLIIGFMLLIKGADFLVDGASALAVRYNVSQIAIGLTIVAFGTSTPELVVNILSSIQKQPDIAFGNIIGSNIVNILLILGIAGVIYPIKTERNTVWKEIPFSLLAGVILFVLCNDRLFSGGADVLSRGDGIILLIFFIIFMIYTFGIAKVESRDEAEVRILSTARIILYILIGLLGLFIGGKLVVDNSVKLARLFGVSEKLIGLTIVSIGTSLPELFTSAVAAYKKQSDIAIGNVVGSNIFNVFFILGVSSVISPLPFQGALNLDIYVLIGVSALLFLTMFTGKKRTLDRWEAIMFVIFYIIYIVFLIIRK
ncbi:MAG: calcium/sodium antiporter [Calditrichia bacterium]